MIKDVLKENYGFRGVVHDFTQPSWGHNYSAHESDKAGNISISAICQDFIRRGDAFVFLNSSSREVWGVVSTEPERNTNPHDSFYFDIEFKGHVNSVDVKEVTDEIDYIDELECELEKLKKETRFFKLLTNKHFRSEAGRNPIEERVRQLYLQAEYFSELNLGTHYTDNICETKSIVEEVFKRAGDKLKLLISDFEKELACVHYDGLMLLSKAKKDKILKYIKKTDYASTKRLA